MNFIFGIGWFLIGIFWIIAGKPFIEVCACFILFGIFEGVNELKLMREEMEAWEEDDGDNTTDV